MLKRESNKEFAFGLKKEKKLEKGTPPRPACSVFKELNTYNKSNAVQPKPSLDKSVGYISYDLRISCLMG